MPRPPILPVPDREAIFKGGKTFEQWLADSPEQANANAIRAAVQTIDIPTPIRVQLAALERPVKIIAIAEAWCGDVVRQVPLLMKMASFNPNIEVRFITREDHLDFFVRFLTNGGESIPKFVFCSEDFVETGNWGPMSTTPREMIARGKACGNVVAARQRIAVFFEADKHREAMQELHERLRVAAFRCFDINDD